MTKKYTFQELCENLFTFPTGTRFKNMVGEVIKVEYLRSTWHSSTKALYWESGEPVTITNDILEDSFELVVDYIQISWQEAFEMIKKAVESYYQRLTGVFIESDDGFQEINTYDDFEEDLDIEDFIDLFRMTFYKSNK